MVIFHSHVSLPEGKTTNQYLFGEALQSPAESVCLLEMKNLGQAEDDELPSPVMEGTTAIVAGKRTKNRCLLLVAMELFTIFDR
jgi:hypothetical protein